MALKVDIASHLWYLGREVVTPQGGVALGFHRLLEAEDLEWARAAVAYAIERYGKGKR